MSSLREILFVFCFIFIFCGIDLSIAPNFRHYSSSTNAEVFEGSVPVVITTWDFVNATAAAWESMVARSSTAIDSIVTCCSVCEEGLCDDSVGYGGSPDENGETALDALIIDGMTFDAGAVANLRRVKNAIGVAHAVMKYTDHTMLVGDLATDFAIEMGFTASNLSTEGSIATWQGWLRNNCQPNYRKNVVPDPKQSCGPYSPTKTKQNSSVRQPLSDAKFNHDTIGVLAIDKYRNIAAGTSTNGKTYKIPGRVGDSSIVGSGAYADGNVGGAAATGDGDVMMRFLPSFYTVELMRAGASPTQAATQAIARIASYYPRFNGGVIATNMAGLHGAACHGWSQYGSAFPYSVVSDETGGEVQVLSVYCTQSP